MLARYDEGMSNGEHPIRVASTLHFDLLTIHPFKDGNGRTARLLENLHSVREGFVPVPGVGDPTEFIAYMADLEKAALERYLAALHTAHGESADPS